MERCEICRTERFATDLMGVHDYISDERFAICRCTGCGLAVTMPFITGDAIERYYPPRYRTDRQKYSGGWRVKRRAAAVQKHFATNFRGRLLDLGCGTGAFAMEMKRRGWDVAVTEINDAVLDDMRKEGMEAKRPDEALRDGFSQKFDAIACWHVLEHVEHPVELAKWCAGQLKPDGILQVTVPNLASWQAKLFGKHWLHLDPPRHRYHFTPHTIDGVLGPHGFRAVDHSTFALEYDLFGWLQSALNPICSRPNVLFEKLTAKGEARVPLPLRDVVISYALSPLILGATLIPCMLAPVARKGGTLTVTARISK